MDCEGGIVIQRLCSSDSLKPLAFLNIPNPSGIFSASDSLFVKFNHL